MYSNLGGGVAIWHVDCARSVFASQQRVPPHQSHTSLFLDLPLMPPCVSAIATGNDCEDEGKSCYKSRPSRCLTCATSEEIEVTCPQYQEWILCVTKSRLYRHLWWKPTLNAVPSWTQVMRKWEIYEFFVSQESSHIFRPDVTVKIDALGRSEK